MKIATVIIVLVLITIFVLIQFHDAFMMKFVDRHLDTDVRMRNREGTFHVVKINPETNILYLRHNTDNSMWYLTIDEFIENVDEEL